MIYCGQDGKDIPIYFMLFMSEKTEHLDLLF